MNKTNTERLEFIKRMYDNDETVFLSDIKYLIEQAERAQKLSEREDAKILLVNNGLEEERYVLQDENERLRKALEFYADKETYDLNVIDQWEPILPIGKDVGEKARQALKGGVLHDTHKA